MEWHFSAADARSAHAARKPFADFLRKSCTRDSDCDAATVVFGELVANAVQHSPGPIEISLLSDAQGLVRLDVCDTGKAFTLWPRLPVADRESGRGLYIISKLSPQVSVSRTPLGNKVSVVLPVREGGGEVYGIPKARVSAAKP